MNSNMSVQCQPSFQGNIRLKDINVNPEKMEKVQKIYSRLTQHYKDDLILARDIIYRDFPGSQVAHHDVAYNTESGYYIGSTIRVRSFQQWFYENTPEQIANGLARIFKYGKYLEKIEPEIQKLTGSINNIKKKAILNRHIANVNNDTRYRFLAKNNEERADILEKELLKLKEQKRAVTTRILDSNDTSVMDYID